MADTIFDSTLDEWTGQRGNVIRQTLAKPYVEFLLAANVSQQSCLVERSFRHDGAVIHGSAEWRFPAGFTWDKAAGYSASSEHKLFILNTDRGVGRMLLNLRGEGVSPVLQVHFERLEGAGGISQYLQTQWPPDGQWHRLEFEITRLGGTRGQFRAWLDNRQVADITGGVGNEPWNGIQVGAFSNQGSRIAQVFGMRACQLRTAARPPGGIVVPTPPDNTDLELIAADVDDLARRTRDNLSDLERLAQRLRGLKMSVSD